jgi:ABC-type lipopolysaccharide export system ATPase subunit
MNDGTVLANGSPNQIIDDETVRKTYLGENFKL